MLQPGGNKSDGQTDTARQCPAKDIQLSKHGGWLELREVYCGSRRRRRRRVVADGCGNSCSWTEACCSQLLEGIWAAAPAPHKTV